VRRGVELWVALGLMACCAALSGCSTDSGYESDGDADGDVAIDSDFDVEPDAEMVLGECDLLSDEGCPEGETCATVVRSGVETEVGCVPRPADDTVAGAGMPCTFSTDDGALTRHDCPPAHACVVTSALGAPRCLRLCAADDPTPCTGAYADVEGARPDGACAMNLGSAAGLEGVRACMMMHDCDPRCGDCPSRYDVCIPVNDTLRVGFACFAYIPEDTGDGRTGDPCTYRNGCRPGYGCYEVDGSAGGRQCRPACDLDGEGECPFSLCGAHEGEEAEGRCTAVPELSFVLPGLGLCLNE